MHWLHAPDYWLARLIIQRGLGGVYFIAFLVALDQFRPLLGERGLLPVPRFVEVVPFREAPSLFHFRYSDRLLVFVSILGMLASLAIVIGLPDRWPVAATIAIWLFVWALYLSIVNVGQRFYGFGWESLLLEAGFLAAFLGPAWSAVPTPLVIAFRWLLFRVELGAGLIKMRGDRSWKDLTALYYHHETQPMPNPLSWWFHRLPKPLHKCEVVGSHFAQLVLPVLLFLPQPIASIAGIGMAITQTWLILSGNFSWLNVVTIILTASAVAMPRGDQATSLEVVRAHDVIVGVLAVALLVLSYRPARNLVSKHQRMNASFDPLHLVNTYGAFGSITKKRFEVVVEGTDEETIDESTVWREYEFRGKPTDPKKRPRQWAPFHLRLDWMMWFAGLRPSREFEWLVPFMQKLLENDRATLRLLRTNPFGEQPPRAVRLLVYRYRFTTWRERRETGAWWVRTFVDEVWPAMTLKP